MDRIRTRESFGLSLPTSMNAKALNESGLATTIVKLFLSVPFHFSVVYVFKNMFVFRYEKSEAAVYLGDHSCLAGAEGTGC